MALDERIKLSFKTVVNKQRGYLTFDNSAVWLAGRLPSSGSPIVHQNPQTERGLIKAKIRELARYDNNLFKWWMFFYPHYFDHQADLQTFFSPFARITSGPNKGRWNLAAPNETYYDALDLAIREAMRYGIVVEIGLFDGPGLKNSGVPDAAKRWPSNPWNKKNNIQHAINGTDGAVKLFFTDPTIRPFQQKYVEEVIERTKQYWNVIYEIINEPGGDLPAEIAWADQVVGWIQAKTAGQRALFYNTFPNRNDIAEWREKNTAGNYVYPNYPNLHGVIFHGDPNELEPTNYAFSAEKAIQASSDGSGGARDTNDWNKTRTEHCFEKDMSFQAHSTTIQAGEGISAAFFNTWPNDQRRTVPVVPWRLIGRLHRRVPDESFDARIFMDGVYIGFKTNPLQIIDRGRITPIGRDRMRNVRGDGVETFWTYTLDESGAVPRLKMKRDDGFKQELDVVSYAGSADDDPAYGDFLFNWERVYASNGSEHFHLRFDVDRSFICFRPGTPAADILRGDVKNLGSDGQGSFIDFFSPARGDERWRYRFLEMGSKLELSSPVLTEQFVRRDAFRPIF